MTLDRYLVKQFLPIFLSALTLFITLVLLIDLFLNLVRYLENGAAIADILATSFYYIPKSVIYALPVSLLFASAYILGDLSARNELTTILGAGFPFWRFCLSLVLMGIMASVFSFFFEDQVVIPTLRKKNELSRKLLNTQAEENLSDIVIKLEEGRLIYSVDYYDMTSQTLNGVTIIEFDQNKSVLFIISADRALWTDDSYWSFVNPLIYDWGDQGFFRPREYTETGSYTEEPDTFKRSSVSAADLNARDAGLLIKDLKRAGLPSVSAQADYHHRFSFSAVSFVVIFLSVTMSGRFKKNILLLSLLASLGVAAIYYVIEMISMMGARVGLVSPVLGAWFPVFVCTAAGLLLLRYGKT
ncbi:MAG: LptF/LptG family permease [Treponema sp.]|jgi:lipopolysaccharide export system permease protein|nr:LptF/LptG family permease [Treponema sp.]